MVDFLYSPLLSDWTEQRRGDATDATAAMTIDRDKTLGSSVQVSTRELNEDSFLASSKVLLTAPFTEIRTESGSSIQSVQLVLTTEREIIVLKQPKETCNKRSFLRRHKLSQTEFAMHRILFNSLTATVPDTILSYTYQLVSSSTSTIKEWLLKIAQCKIGTAKPRVKNNSPERDTTNTAGQPTMYERTEETLNSHSYSSPTHPVQRLLPHFPQQGTKTTAVNTLHPPKMAKCRPFSVVQMPSGLIKASSFQDRGSTKHQCIRRNSSSSDLDKCASTLNEDSTASTHLPPSISRTPSPLTDENPFESRLRHTQVRNKKRFYSPRMAGRSNSSQGPSNPQLEELQDTRVYSRSANSTPLPGLSSSLVIASPLAGTSDIAGPSSVHSSNGTLPRAKKGKKERVMSVSSDPSNGSPSKLSSKSPKLLRMLHRRWQSSSAIKVPLNLDGEDALCPQAEGGPKKVYLFSAKEVAEELSVMDSELLRKIGPEELENGAWMKKDSKDKLAPNIMAMVRSFNQLALLIPSEILEEKTAQGRAKIITSYIQIAYKLYTSRNYNSLKAILAGLQSTPIYRLKKTWKEVPSKKRKRFDQLSALMSECENWQLYRSEVDRRLSSGTPLIPFLGQFLTQVVQTDTYNQARENRKALTPQADSPTKSLPVSIERQCRRSSSLDPTIITPDSICPSPPTKSLTAEEPPLSISAPSSPLHTGYRAALTKKGSTESPNSKAVSHTKSLSSDSSCLSPTSDMDEADGHDDNAGHTTDSSSSTEYRVSPSLQRGHTHSDLFPCPSSAKDVEMRESQIELNQIYVSLCRHSKSYDELLNNYTNKDPGLKDVLHRTLNELNKLSASLQSLDSVFSEEEEEDDSSEPLTSSLSITYPVEFDSDQGHTSDYGSDALQNESPVIEKPEKVKKHKIRRILFRAKSENASNVCPVSSEHEQCIDEEENNSVVEITNRKVQRSKSYSSGSKGNKRRQYHRRKLHKPSDDNSSSSKEPKSAAEMLNAFQVASLGYSMGAKENSSLRSAIFDAEPNSESVSYKLSVEREAHDLP